MKCGNRECSNQTQEEGVLCLSCMADQVIELAGESINRVSKGENIQAVKAWFFDVLLEWSKNPYYRYCCSQPAYGTAVDQGLEGLLEKLGLQKEKGSEPSHQRRRAASDLGLFVLPPVEAPATWLSQPAAHTSANSPPPD